MTQFFKKQEIWTDKKDECQNDYFAGGSDIELWEAFKKGNNKAFDRIYHTYIPQLYNYGCHLCNDRELVRDCIHDLFVTLISNKARLGNTDNIKFYLFKAYKRKLVKLLRKRNHTRRRESVFSDEHFRLSIENDFIQLNGTITQETREFIQEAINKLPSSQKEAVILFYYEGLGYREIASLMGQRNVKSARTLIYRAIDSLTKKIKSTHKILLLFIKLLVFSPLY